MHGLDTIHDMNNESDKNADMAAEALTGDEIANLANKERAADAYRCVRREHLDNAAKKELQESQEYLTGDAGYAKAQAEATRLNANMDIPKWSEPRNET